METRVIQDDPGPATAGASPPRGSVNPAVLGAPAISTYAFNATKREKTGPRTNRFSGFRCALAAASVEILRTAKGAPMETRVIQDDSSPATGEGSTRLGC